MGYSGGTLLVLVLVALLNLTLGKNPGIVMRLTSKGISYAEEVTQRLLNERIKSLEIEDQSGEDGSLTWSLSKVVSTVTGPDVDISLNPAVGGTTMSVSNINIKVKADWHAEYQVIVKIPASGSLEADITKAAVTIQVHLDEKDGRPTFDIRHCDAKIGDINLKFSGGIAATFLNLFRSSVNYRVRNILEGKTCEIVKKEAQNILENQISKLPVTVDLLHGNFMLDYSLVDRPKIGYNYVELHHKGSFYYKKAIGESPLEPSPILGFNKDEKMFYILVTENSTNTFSYAAHHNNFLQHRFAFEDLARVKDGRFNPTDKIESAVPGTKLEFLMKSSSPPEIKFGTDTVKVDGEGTVELVAKTAFKSSTLLTLDAKVAVKITPSIQNNTMIMSLTDLEIELSTNKTILSSLLVRHLNPLIQNLIKVALLPKLNQLGSQGVALPTGKTVQLVDPQLLLTPGVLEISSNIHYK